MSFTRLLTVAALLAAGMVPPVVARAQALITLHSFTGGTDGRSPAGNLAYHGGLLYGQTGSGGVANAGTVFQLDPITRAERVLYNFKGGVDYGFSYSGVIYQGGFLYGTSYTGVQGKGYGTVFKINTSTGVETVLHSFTGNADGGNPFGVLAYKSGFLYGTTSYSTGSSGTLFRIDAATGATTVLYNFTGGNDTPNGAVLLYNGLVYGTTTSSVYKFDPTTRQLTNLYTFTGGADGSLPNGPLIYRNGFLYGTTTYGGLGFGTVFKVDLITGSEVVIYNFTNESSGNPSVGLIYLNGFLYGTTGGIAIGVVFKVNVTTGAGTTLHSFTGGADGANPFFVTLIYRNGFLYGTTRDGTQLHGGTVFKLTP